MKFRSTSAQAILFWMLGGFFIPLLFAAPPLKVFQPSEQLSGLLRAREAVREQIKKLDLPREITERDNAKLDLQFIQGRIFAQLSLELPLVFSRGSEVDQFGAILPVVNQVIIESGKVEEKVAARVAQAIEQNQAQTKLATERRVRALKGLWSKRGSSILTASVVIAAYVAFRGDHIFDQEYSTPLASLDLLGFLSASTLFPFLFIDTAKQQRAHSTGETLSDMSPATVRESLERPMMKFFEGMKKQLGLEKQSMSFPELVSLAKQHQKRISKTVACSRILLKQNFNPQAVVQGLN